MVSSIDKANAKDIKEALSQFFSLPNDKIISYLKVLKDIVCEICSEDNIDEIIAHTYQLTSDISTRFIVQRFLQDFNNIMDDIVTLNTIIEYKGMEMR